MRRTRLPDDAWVVERSPTAFEEDVTMEKMNSEITFHRSASRLEEERLKAVQELEEVKNNIVLFPCLRPTSFSLKCIPVIQS